MSKRESPRICPESLWRPTVVDCVDGEVLFRLQEVRPSSIVCVFIIPCRVIGKKGFNVVLKVVVVKHGENHHNVDLSLRSKLSFDE